MAKVEPNYLELQASVSAAMAVFVERLKNLDDPSSSDMRLRHDKTATA
jgi:hypothetical protein